MKALLDIKRFKFYLWVALAYVLVNMMGNLVYHRGSYGARFMNECWLAVYMSVLNYILFEYTLKQASWKGLFKFLLFLFTHLMLYSFGLYAWRSIGMALHIYTELQTFDSVEKAVGHFFSYSIGSLFFFGIVRHIYNYIKLKRTARQLRIEKQAAELNYLKSQTNPHFLFNTLNNIYSLARDKSDLAAESVLRLSKILRFMLYETSGAYITLEQEIKIIDDYIALEKLRYDETLRVNFMQDMENMQQAIPPLLLIPLVENAFKHGVSETLDRPFVDILLSVNNRQLHFTVKNSSEGERSVKENIGLANLRRQLELLYTDYNLSVQQGETIFTAVLKINLASHV